MLAGGEPVLGGALLLVFFSFFFLSLLFVFFIVFIVLVISAVASPPGGHDSETTTAVDEVQKTRLTKEGRRRQTGYPHLAHSVSYRLDCSGFRTVNKRERRTSFMNE